MQYHRLSKSSRREFLEGAVALALTEPAFMRAGKNQTSRTMPSVLAYVGTYSSPQGPEGTSGHGQGIYLLEMDRVTGAVRQREDFPSGSRPGCVSHDDLLTLFDVLQ